MKHILVRTRCAICLGSGVIVHWAWKAAYEKDLYREDTEKWLAEQPKTVPPRSVKCEYCKGKGHTEEWENIKELGIGE